MDELITLITAAYEQAELKLLERMQQLILLGLDEDEAAGTLLGKKLAQLKTLREETIKQLRQLATLDDTARQEIIKQFLQGSTVAGDVAGSNNAALNNLVADYLKLLQDSRFQILRQTQDVYRNIIAQVTEQATLGTQTRIQTARRALEKFAGEGITAFISKDNRRWEIRDYARMATRTTLLNAQREGRIAGLESNGNDLIIVRTSPRYCPLCAPYKDKILSIGGKDDRYPSLSSAKAAGLYHPQCRCSFTAYVSGLTEIKSKERIENNYDAEEEQRKLERSIRKYKRILVVDPDNKRAKNKLQQKRDEIRLLIEDEKLTRKPQNESNVSAR